MSETLAVVRASRPNFLLLAPLCAGLGLAVAWQQGQAPELLHTFLVFLGAVLAHAAVNLLNEYDDFRSGLDMITERTPFSGGSGALPEVPSAARRVLWAGLGTLAVVVTIGLYFLWLRGLPLLVLGAAGVVLVLTYTRWITRSPLLCLLAPGMGFGPIMVLGTVIALGASIDTTALLVSLVALLMVSELLLINQIPDAEADRAIGRRHLVITLGPEKAAHLVAGLLLASYGVIVAGVVSGYLAMTSLIALAPLPAAIWISLRLPRVLAMPDQLNHVLGANVAVLLSTLALLVTGLSL
ncbi:prenyltransferase UbiA [Marinobacter sp. EVN1]|jgi:1,4-dihydroxy-2-naphthoate octaprenyltransferase|uniref:1,4-dihydroxy-2-naphthoate octaprenyltransferase n=1 Tax=Marinobacter nauticus TaxID=2743 RepID=A0A368V7L9_MARNT|nr:MULTISPECIES: prenyltransferase [Marinobacter]ERS85488.1 prenyltransferase UbiA [Marinobacter sp. EVN1]MCC4271202.1 prenyltransferase [Marinobacter nauticus]RBP75491.1 1,4-dihydroxy-2-naphthoate octaprenyltransferase [Marinobacter nauticus]RCW36300.1 1,4-dihydroxy-2-naphthoate octaprenyltransferase [Marinobacter nauticus]TPW23794.1 prenyltransferase [Marinobacter nauticus]